MANQNQNEWRERELGALWKKKSDSGATRLTGKLKINGKEINVVIFPNKFKADNEKAPDFRVYLSEPNPNEQGARTNNTRPQTARTGSPRRQAPVEPLEDVSEPVF
jgi:uncharacterized protein (DUF736 family)